MPRLFEEIADVGRQIEAAHYGFCDFGVATPNNGYEETPKPVQTEDGTRWSETRSSYQREPYFFHRQEPVLDLPALAPHLSIVLLYRETI